MADPVSEPIKVNGSPWPDQAFALVRQVIPPVAVYLVATGRLGQGADGLIIGLSGVLLPIIYGQLKTRLRARQLSTIAGDPEVPDHVAAIKGQESGNG